MNSKELYDFAITFKKNIICRDNCLRFEDFQDQENEYEKFKELVKEHFQEESWYREMVYSESR